MRRHTLVLALLIGCKNPEEQAADARQQKVRQALNDGHAAMAARDYDTAMGAFGKASSLAPNDPQSFLLLAQAQREAGNEAAAVMSLKHAEELGAKSDPEVKRQRAELYRRLGQVSLAISTLVEMREQNQLTDAELLSLAKLQARTADTDGAWETLERVQARKPDDLDAKVAEAEILLVKGDEVLAANLMDRLLKENPQLTGARLLRARYFLTNGYPEMAEADLGQIGPEGQKDADVLELKARVLNVQKRYEEAIALLQPLVEKNPRDADLACQLAETQLLAGHPDEAQALVDLALAQRASFPKALYVRGRAYEEQRDDHNAMENYKYALRTDPTFAPVLSRVWRIYREKDQKNEAISALEKLLFMKEASPEERIALATLYADTGLNLDRGRKLVDEQLKASPHDQALKDLKKRLGRAKVKAPTVQVIRHR
jgi:tetratricopeptide (TPR) repeat protein